MKILERKFEYYSKSEGTLSPTGSKDNGINYLYE
jgi:hypothetical protein